jgi:hypothetical protein
MFYTLVFALLVAGLFSHFQLLSFLRLLWRFIVAILPDGLQSYVKRWEEAGDMRFLGMGVGEIGDHKELAKKDKSLLGRLKALFWALSPLKEVKVAELDAGLFGGPPGMHNPAFDCYKNTALQASQPEY